MTNIFPKHLLAKWMAAVDISPSCPTCDDIVKFTRANGIIRRRTTCKHIGSFCGIFCCTHMLLSRVGILDKVLALLVLQRSRMLEHPLRLSRSLPDPLSVTSGFLPKRVSPGLKPLIIQDGHYDTPRSTLICTRKINAVHYHVVRLQVDWSCCRRRRFSTLESVSFTTCITTRFATTFAFEDERSG